MFSTNNMDHSIFSGSVHQETGISLGYLHSLVANRGYWVCKSFSEKWRDMGNSVTDNGDVTRIYLFPLVIFGGMAPPTTAAWPLCLKRRWGS
jgi:hypothetical protein